MVRFLLVWAAACLAAASVQAASVTPPPIEDYGKLPAMDFVTLSPSGQRYAFVATIGEKRRLVVATTGQQVLEADDLGALKVESLEWAGDDHVLVHNSATRNLGLDFVVNKTELVGVVVVDVAHHKAMPVFGNPYQKSVAHTVIGSYGSAEINGHWYGFFGGYTYEHDKGGGQLQTTADGVLYPDLYRVDLDTGDFVRASPGQDGIRDWLVDAKGEIVARLIMDRKSGAWRLLNSRFAGDVLATGLAPTGDIRILGFGHDADSILVETSGAEHDLIEERPLHPGPVKASYSTDEIDRPIHDTLTKLWIGSTLNAENAPPEFFDPLRQAKVKGAYKAFPGYQVSLISRSADFNRMVMFTDGGDDSGTYWLVDIAKGSADVLGAKYPTVKASQVGPIRWVDYKAADGLAMRGVLTLPPGRTPKSLPLVVMPHGGPEAHDSLGFDYWAQAFAVRGYAVFQPNFRGSSGAGNAFRDAGFGQWGRKMQTDISDGVAELVRQGIVDPKRACIAGWSYGGYAALAGVTVQHGLYRCAVSMAGVADLPLMLNYEADSTGDASTSTHYWKKFMGVTTTWETELKDISPARLADRADAPILLVHGKEDTVVPIEQSEKMDRALVRAGKPVEFVTLPGADHWLLHEDARVAMLKASVEFVLKNNPPDAAPATAVAGN